MALAAHEPEDAGHDDAGYDDAGYDEAGYDEVGITLVTDAAMRALNRTFRSLGRTTDVLAFDLRGARTQVEPRTGEVVISTDRVLAQARRYRATPARELARLAVHGILHLRGLDHQRMAERRRMRAFERRLLNALAPAVGRLVLAPRRPSAALRPR